MKKAFAALDRIIGLIENLLCAVPVGFILVVEMVQVFYRYVLKSGIPWSDEVITNLIVIVVMFGSARAIRTREHTELTGTVDSMPQVLRTIVRILTTLATLVFLVVLFWASVQFVSTTGNLKTTYLRIPKVYCYMAIPVGTLLMIYEFVKTIKYRITRPVIDIYDPELYREEE